MPTPFGFCKKHVVKLRTISRYIKNLANKIFFIMQPQVGRTCAKTTQ